MNQRVKILKCDAVTKDLGKNKSFFCDQSATFWDPQNQNVYCTDHAIDSGNLQPVSGMNSEAFDEIWARQQIERSRDDAK